MPVLIWKISEHDEKNLDIYEGFPNLYIKKNLTLNVTSLDGYDLGNLTAMVYIMTKKAAGEQDISPLPGEYYYSVLEEGYKTFGFDGKILNEGVKEAFGHLQPQNK